MTSPSLNIAHIENSALAPNATVGTLPAKVVKQAIKSKNKCKNNLFWVFHQPDLSPIQASVAVGKTYQVGAIEFKWSVMYSHSIHRPVTR